MGSGLAQIALLLVLTVIGLPLFFFALMAALDRFERSLSAQPRVAGAAATVAPALAAFPATAETAEATGAIAAIGSVTLPAEPAEVWPLNTTA